MAEDLTTKGRKPGFQRSETSSAELHIYQQPTDPILSLRSPDAGKELRFDGRRRYDESPSLVALGTNKVMGAASGQFTALVLSGKANLQDIITDDAWVDIHFSRHNRRYFTMRGSIDSVQRTKSVGGDGATTVAYTISGRDFGKVWELTPIWFNKYVDSATPPENVAGAASMRVVTSILNSASVPEMVALHLEGFLKELSGFGRANWEYPSGMPGIGEDQSFISNLGFDISGYSDNPPRITVPDLNDPNGANAWAMAQEWSDPAFCELFADLSDSSFIDASDQLSTDSAIPTYFLRDRPFPTLESGTDSPWYYLPMITVPREDIVEDDLTRGGLERFNAFFVSPRVAQEWTGNAAIEVTAPLWDEKDMLIHGFRRYDIDSKYQLNLAKAGTRATDDSLLTLTKEQRARIRDWYCLNPYLWSGTVACARGVLEARIGRRLLIPGLSPSENLTGYIEGVNHNWRFGQGIRTTLTITRGWYGTDDSYLKALQVLSARYGGNRQGDFVPTPSTGTVVA